MAERIICGNCGGKVPLPAGYAKSKIRCGACGYYAEVPPEMRAAPGEPPVLPPNIPTPDEPSPFLDEPKPKKPKSPASSAPPVRSRANPRDTRPEFVVDEAAAPPLLVGSQEEDDDLPYTVTGSGLKECPACRNELPLDAVLCVHCGVDLHAGANPKKKRKRTYTVIDETFHEGMKPTTRRTLFLVMQVSNVIITFSLSSLTSTSEEKDALFWGTSLVAILINGGLQAFILGTYQTLRVERTSKGRGTLTKQLHIAFLPRPEVNVEWKPHAGVDRLIQSNGSIVGWIVCLYLLGLGCLPGIVFYMLELHPERYDVHLANTYGGVEEVIFHSRNLEQADGLVALIADATGLQQPKRRSKSS